MCYVIRMYEHGAILSLSDIYRMLFCWSSRPDCFTKYCQCQSCSVLQLHSFLPCIRPCVDDYHLYFPFPVHLGPILTSGQATTGNTFESTLLVSVQGLYLPKCILRSQVSGKLQLHTMLCQHDSSEFLRGGSLYEL